MSEHGEGFRVTFGYETQRDRSLVSEFPEWPHAVANDAIDGGGNRGFGEAFTDTGGDIEG